jgi:hypothetical protein
MACTGSIDYRSVVMFDGVLVPSGEARLDSSWHDAGAPQERNSSATRLRD